MSADASHDDSDSAVRLFVAWMDERDEGRGPTFDELCTGHPDMRPRLLELEALHERARALVEPEGGARAPASPSVASGLEGTRYEPRGEIARGGMGSILEAYDPSLRRTIAVKVLRDRGPLAQGPEAAEYARHASRLSSEAQVLAQLDHPGVVPIYEAGQDEQGLPYFAMKRVHGQDFEAVIRAHHARDDAWRLSHAVEVLRRVCEAVAYAHSKGVIHRDLKPANVMVGRFGEVFVMDWGLAKVIARSDAEEPHPGADPEAPVRTDRARSAPTSTVDTQHGSVLGTPGYMAPEQAAGEIRALDARADVYAIGAMLYHLLAGRAPYALDRKAGSTERVQRLLLGPPEPLARVARGAPEELVAIAEKAMARDPAARYPTAAELAAELVAWLEGRVVRAHRTGAWMELRKWVGRNRGAAAAVAAILLGLLGTALVQSLSRRELAQRAEALRREDTINRIALASAAFSNGDIGHMQRLLEGCPADLRGWEWSYLEHAADTSTLALRVEDVDLHDVRLFSDGHTLLTAGSGTPARIALWDVTSKRQVREIRLPEGHAINNVSFSGDGALLAVFGRLGELLLWDTRDWSPLPSLDVEMHGWHGVAFAPTGRRLAAFATEGVQLWDVERRACLAKLSANQKDIADVAWSPDGRRLCASSWDGSVSVWDTENATLVTQLRVGTARMQQIEWSPDGRWIAGGDWDSRVHVWDAQTLAPVHHSDRVGGHILAMAWSPDSKRLAVGGKGVVIRIFEAGTWEPIGRLIGHASSVQALAFSADGRTIVSAGAIGSVRLWDLGREDWRTQYHEGGREPPAAVAFSGEGSRFAVGWSGGSVEIWDARQHRYERTCVVGGSPRHLDWSRATPRLAVADWSEGIQVIDPDGAAPPQQIPVSQPTEVHFDPAGARLAATAQDGFLRVWEVASGKLLWEQHLPIESGGWPGNLFGASWSPRGDELVACAFGGRIQVRDAASGALRRETQRPGMLFAQFCGDGRHVLTWDYSGNRGMELLDAATLAPLWTSERTNHMWPILSPDCARVFSANWQGFLGVWDAHNGRLLAEIEGLPPGNPRLAVAPDGGCVVLAMGNRLRFFDPRREP